VNASWGSNPTGHFGVEFFIIRHPSHYQTGGFSCQVRQDIEYFNLQTPKNNPGWRMKWFYTKDKSSTGQNFGLKAFWPTTVIRPRASWAHELSEEEMKITQPLMGRSNSFRPRPRKSCQAYSSFAPSSSVGSSH
jgi:hypothetical protein